MGYYIAKRLHGRRMKLILIMLMICFVSDIGLDLTRILTDDNINDGEPWKDFDNVFSATFFSISTVMIFLIYFTVCMLGMIDISKVELLNNNRNLTALLACFTWFVEEYIKALVQNKLVAIADEYVPVWMILDNLATLLAVFFLYPNYLIEQTEVNSLQKIVKKENTNQTNKVDLNQLSKEFTVHNYVETDKRVLVQRNDSELFSTID